MKKKDDLLLIALFLGLWWMKQPKGDAEAIVKSAGGGRYYTDNAGYVYYEDTDGKRYLVDEWGNKSSLETR